MASKRRGVKAPDALVFTVLVLILLLLAGGCQRFRTPGAKEARLIAAENMQLEGELADCQTEIARITKEQTRSMKELQDKLVACQKRNEHLQKDIQEGIAKRTDSVLSTVMAENARLRAEIKRLLGQN